MWKEFGASMGTQTTRKSALLIFITLPLLPDVESCAPSFVLFGAFFPAWMLCASLNFGRSPPAASRRRGR
jgi:hypothetical protein